MRARAGKRCIRQSPECSEGDKGARHGGIAKIRFAERCVKSGMCYNIAMSPTENQYTPPAPAKKDGFWELLRFIFVAIDEDRRARSVPFLPSDSSETISA